MNNHEAYMRRCLSLASQAAGNVSPNPLVGAVIVHEDRIIGEGYHRAYGGPHAEVNAIQDVLERYGNSADQLLKKSALYVNLEPCAHFGKTPPCSDLIIRHEIPQVIIGNTDPFDAVNGKGIEKLENAGKKVVTGVLASECEWLNRRFFTRIRKQRPYIILKWAQTADGFFAPANGSQKWISSALSKKLSHRWRSEEDAVLVGKNTALADDPQLNVREWIGRNPKRIVIDRDLQLPAHLHLFDQSAETIVFNRLKTELKGTVKYLEVEDFDQYLPQMILYQLYLMDIQSLIIEGGAQTLDLFIKPGLWDEARIFSSGDSWETGLKAPEIKGSLLASEEIGADILNIYYQN